MSQDVDDRGYIIRVKSLLKADIIQALMYAINQSSSLISVELNAIDIAINGKDVLYKYINKPNMSQGLLEEIQIFNSKNRNNLELRQKVEDRSITTLSTTQPSEEKPEIKLMTQMQALVSDNSECKQAVNSTEVKNKSTTTLSTTKPPKEESKVELKPQIQGLVGLYSPRSNYSDRTNHHTCIVS